MKKELQPLRRYWADSKLNEEDRFLRDYITKRMWNIDSNDTDGYMQFDPVRT